MERDDGEGCLEIGRRRAQMEMMVMKGVRRVGLR